MSASCDSSCIPPNCLTKARLSFAIHVAAAIVWNGSVLLRKYRWAKDARRDGQRLAVLSIGPFGYDVEQAIDETGLPVAHYDLRFLKPLDEELLEEVAHNYDRILTVEDGARKGGMGSAVLEWMADHHYHPSVVRLGLPDHFVPHGTVEELRRLCGIDTESIAKAISQLYANDDTAVDINQHQQ